MKFQGLDVYGNVIQFGDKTRYDVKIEDSDKTVLYPLEWEMESCQMSATFSPREVGPNMIIIHVVDKRFSPAIELACYCETLMLRPPCSPFISLEFFDNNLQLHATAGKEFTFEVKNYDVLGGPALQYSNATCHVVVQDILGKKTTPKEQALIEKINTPSRVYFAITICFKKAGLRQARVVLNSGSKSSFKDFCIDVQPGTPHHLAHVRFITSNAIDESFSPRSTVIYRNQWSTLHAILVDCYCNAVRELTSDYDVSLELYNTKGAKAIGIKYEDEEEIQNESFQVRVKIKEAGKYNLYITLRSKSNPKQIHRLKDTQIQVIEAPLYLAGSEFHYPDSCVAGKKIEIEITPYDVFGCPLHATSTSNYDLTGDILEKKYNEESIDIKVTEKSKNSLCFTAVLTKTGHRKLMIFDKDNKRKELSICVNPDLSDVQKNVISHKGTAFEKEKSTLKKHSSDTVSRREGSSLRTIVEDVSLDSQHSTIDWIPQYADIEDQPLFPEDESFRCCLKLKDVAGRDCGKKIRKDCIKVKYDNIEVENVQVTPSSARGSYNIVVPLENLKKGDLNPTFLFFVNHIKIEKALILNLEAFRKYDDDSNCQVRDKSIIEIYGIEEKDISADHVKNIKRICKLVHHPEVYFGDVTIFQLVIEENECKIQKCRNVLLRLLRAIHYRKRAFELDEEREEWKQRAIENYRKVKRGSSTMKNLPSFCRQIKEKYAKLMQEYHDAACEEFFQFFNSDRNQSEIDLHGLLVADEQNLHDYEDQMLSKFDNLYEVYRIIEEERDHANEAIRYCISFLCKLKDVVQKLSKKTSKQRDSNESSFLLLNACHILFLFLKLFFVCSCAFYSFILLFILKTQKNH